MRRVRGVATLDNMTLPDHTTPGASRRRINPVPVVGFSIVLLAAAAPLNDVQLWVGLTDRLRWNYTGLVFAAIALGAVGWMLAHAVRTRVPLYLVTVSATAVIAGHLLFVYWALDAPGEDEYLTSAMDLLGNQAMFASAAAGLALALVPRRPIEAE